MNRLVVKSFFVIKKFVHSILQQCNIESIRDYTNDDHSMSLISLWVEHIKTKPYNGNDNPIFLFKQQNQQQKDNIDDYLMMIGIQTSFR